MLDRQLPGRLQVEEKEVENLNSEDGAWLQESKRKVQDSFVDEAE